MGAHGTEDALGLIAPFLEFGEFGVGEGGLRVGGGREGPGIEVEGLALQLEKLRNGLLDEFPDEGDGADDVAQDIVPALARFALGQPLADVCFGLVVVGGGEAEGVENLPEVGLGGDGRGPVELRGGVGLGESELGVAGVHGLAGDFTDDAAIAAVAVDLDDPVDALEPVEDDIEDG